MQKAEVVNEPQPGGLQNPQKSRLVEYYIYVQLYITYPSNTLSSWWFQPIWKIFVKLDHFPNFRAENFKNMSNKTTQLWPKARSSLLT